MPSHYIIAVKANADHRHLVYRRVHFSRAVLISVCGADSWAYTCTYVYCNKQQCNSSFVSFLSAPFSHLYPTPPPPFPVPNKPYYGFSGRKAPRKTKLVPSPPRQRRIHCQQLSLIATRTQYRGDSFLSRTIRDWNSLSKNAVEATTVDTFVSRASHWPVN